MESFPTLETGRLLLTELKSTDIPMIVKYASNKKISDNTLNIPYPYLERDAIFWINLANQGFQNSTNLIFAIRLKTDRNFIGGMSLSITQQFKRAEIGYWIAEPFWRKGFATEAIQSVIKFGFENLDLNKLTSSHFAKNPISGKVMVNGGMKKEGHLKEHVQKNSEYQDLILYGLTKTDYERQ